MKSSNKNFINSTVIPFGVIVLGLTMCTAVFGVDLLMNGSFESGNTGFGTDLGYVAGPPFGATENGVYGIGTNPAEWFYYASWSSMGDHTSGTGLMMIATPDPGNARIWFETEDVTAGTTYTFSGWAAHVSIGAVYIANLSINAQDTSLGTFNLSTLPVGTWGQFSFNYTAESSGPVTFSITDLATSNDGNDFALDDLSLSVVPEPSSFALVGVGTAMLLTLVGACAWRRQKLAA
jgi:hypothetical protein